MHLFFYCLQIELLRVRTSFLLLGLPPRKPLKNADERVSRWELGKQSSHTNARIAEEKTGGAACDAAVDEPSKAKA